MRSASTSEPGRRFFPPAWARVVCVVGVLASGYAAHAIHSAQGWSWLAAASAMVALCIAAGAVDAFTSKVELYPERVVVVANLVRREYARDGFAGVSWSRGTPVTLKFRSGATLRLPGVGPGAQSVFNSVRAWLARDAA